ncbi:unnamed protein product [Angiostrongylus costaricensis]|uniref:Uncharacterized protein n=1 Tax=Angiostrongylus costaricensis TaxID=334426 RepID=A0A0R3PJ09_ANGCS|nr:unnamed protein product [Angiostrongylus costaricensis]
MSCFHREDDWMADVCLLSEQKTSTRWKWSTISRCSFEPLPNGRSGRRCPDAHRIPPIAVGGRLLSSVDGLGQPSR